MSLKFSSFPLCGCCLLHPPSPFILLRSASLNLNGQRQRWDFCVKENMKQEMLSWGNSSQLLVYLIHHKSKEKDRKFFHQQKKTELKLVVHPVKASTWRSVGAATSQCIDFSICSLRNGNGGNNWCLVTSGVPLTTAKKFIIPDCFVCYGN